MEVRGYSARVATRGGLGPWLMQTTNGSKCSLRGGTPPPRCYYLVLVFKVSLVTLRRANLVVPRGSLGRSEVRGMATFLAHDDGAQGAPLATCGTTDAFVALAPLNCIRTPGSAPPTFTFDRSDYFWLALSLTTYDVADLACAALDSVLFGMHTLSWSCMHSVVSTAVSLGFQVPSPSSIDYPVRTAIDWSSSRQSVLRKLVIGDFESLPPLPRGAPLLWWRSTSFSSWATDGFFHSLCHAIGFSGKFWHPDSRAPDSRLHLSMLLTQEFLAVSPTVPVSMYGDSAIRFYIITMPPSVLTVFPGATARMLGAMTNR